MTVYPYPPFLPLASPTCVNACRPQSRGCKRRKNQLGIPVIFPFLPQIWKSSMWSQPLEGRGVSGHAVRSGGSSLAFHCLSPCTWRGERTICRISCSLVPLSVARTLQPGRSSCTSLQKILEQWGSGVALAILGSRAVLEAEHQPTSEQIEISTREGFYAMKPSVTRNVMGSRSPFKPQ